MDPLITIIVSTLLTAFVGIIVAYARYVHNLKERVAVLEQTIKDLQSNMQQNIEELRRTMERTISSFQNTINDMKKRQDSHSKKQDDIVQLITDLKVDFVKEIGTVSTNMGVMASNIENLTNLIKVSDIGIKIDRTTK